MHVDPPSSCNTSSIYSNKKKKNSRNAGSFYNTSHCRRYTGGSENVKVKNNNLMSSYRGKRNTVERDREHLVRALHS